MTFSLQGTPNLDRETLFRGHFRVSESVHIKEADPPRDSARDISHFRFRDSEKYLPHLLLAAETVKLLRFPLSFAMAHVLSVLFIYRIYVS